jgi:hypothetical protein
LGNILLKNPARTIGEKIALDLDGIDPLGGFGVAGIDGLGALLVIIGGMVYKQRLRV